MKIEKVKAQNFYSFKEVSLDFSNYSNLTLIKGKNNDTGGSNGSGKSALVEALFFGLTGKTIRKSTESSLVNNQAKKKCKVEVHITHNDEDIVITRQKKPTKLEFLVGKENRTKDSVIATQAAINSFLNINHKVLLASMFFGQSNDVNFLDCTADDKRTIIRTFLNLDDIFLMRDKIRSNKSAFYQGIKEKEAVITENSKNIAILNKKIDKVEEAKKEFKSYDDHILSLSLDDILEEENTFSQNNIKIKDIRGELSSLSSKINKLSKRLESFGKEELCGECGQTVVISFDKDRGIRNLTLMKEDRDSYNDELSSLISNLKRPEVSSREFSSILEYKNLCRDETNYEDIKKELSDSIEEARKEQDFNKIWYEVMRFWEKAFSEQGIIKHIINNILEHFNDRCNFYLSYLTNSKYFVEFDRELNEKIETDGRLIQYISLSGGEKRKVNLAIMLGLKDLLLLTDKSHVDLIFFDEVAENIDEEGIQGLHQLLMELKKTKTIFVITHNKYLKTLLDSSPRLSIIKDKGISYIKE